MVGTGGVIVYNYPKDIKLIVSAFVPNTVSSCCSVVLLDCAATSLWPVTTLWPGSSRYSIYQHQKDLCYVRFKCAALTSYLAKSKLCLHHQLRL